MRQIRRSALVGHTPARMYGLINDIERYPEFIPWCTRAEVKSRSPAEIVATLWVKRGLLRAQFTTRNVLEADHSIQMHLVDGPFRSLDGGWLLTPIVQPAGTATLREAPQALGCKVELQLRFEFSNALTAKVFEPLFEETAGMLVDAFVARARSAA
jgi:ribosome-associated toxin RatA of RatAB toxin-antitoxin module